jgi:hypothetical protein
LNGDEAIQARGNGGGGRESCELLCFPVQMRLGLERESGFHAVGPKSTKIECLRVETRRLSEEKDGSPVGKYRPSSKFLVVF